MAASDDLRDEHVQPTELGQGLASLGGRGGCRRVLFVSSSGGHLSQLLQLRPWWVHHDRQWVTFDLPDARSKLAGETLIPAHHPTTRNLINLVRNTPLAHRVLRRFRPDVVISNGAGVAVPFFGIAKAMGIPTVYLEVYDRIDSKTLTGRLCAPLSSLFLVQWPEQRQLYEGSALVGPLY
jgi:UDP-N-acetylglucosamine:LPS N-acetylglucosamine transferase